MTTMTIWLYTQCFLMFFLGQALHLFLVKIPSVKKRAMAANKSYVFKEWWDCDWNIIVGTQTLGLMIVIGLSELTSWKPEILESVRWFFAGVGAFGSTIAMAKFSQYEKNLVRLLDVKSNIADAVTGGTTEVVETIVRGTEATHTDVSKNK